MPNKKEPAHFVERKRVAQFVDVVSPDIRLEM